MFKAIQDNDAELVAFYLNAGIDPNYQHPEFMALPLAESIRYGHLEIAELLLRRGAKTSIVEMESGSTALGVAQKIGNQAAATLLEGFQS